MAVPPEILSNARTLRVGQTDAEKLLWTLLRDRRFCGYKFRRQHPVDRYILDFYCHDMMLAIELDGGAHNSEERKAYDSERTREIFGAGIRVIRFWNHDVLNRTDLVLETIHAALNPHPVRCTTLSPGERGLLLNLCDFCGFAVQRFVFTCLRRTVWT